LVHTQLPSMHHSVQANDILRVFQQMSPHLLAIAMHSAMTQDNQAQDALQQLINYMQKHGHNPDPYGMFQAMYQYMGQAGRFGDEADETTLQ
jgi:hypothetical protein